MLLRVAAFDTPHVPLTAVGGVCVTDEDAEQEAFAPPFKPEQTQLHGPDPEMVEAVPMLQRPIEGALATLVPLAGPQLAATGKAFHVRVPVVHIMPVVVYDCPNVA